MNADYLTSLLDKAAAEHDAGTTNRRTLAQLMLAWEDLQALATRLDHAITTAVLSLQETVVTGNVRATFSNGRRSFHYKAIGQQFADPALIDAFTETKTVTRTDWRALALDGLHFSKEEIPCTQSDPSVRIQLQ